MIANDDTKGPPLEANEEAVVTSGVDANGEPTVWNANEAEAALPHDHERLDLAEEERLPWLESDEDLGEPVVDSGRIIGFIGLGLIALAALVGGIWWLSHRSDQNQLTNADGSVIEAPATPYKEAPKVAGGKTYQGTGDTSFSVSQGQSHTAKLAGAEAQAGTAHPATPKPGIALAPAAGGKSAPAASGAPVAAAAASGVGVQVGAFSSQASAEAAWTRLSARYEALAKLHHRVVEGKADIGTVYRLQALSPDSAGATALCSGLKTAGLACQVKG